MAANVYSHNTDLNETASKAPITAENQLASCENYFLFWLGDSIVEQDMIDGSDDESIDSDESDDDEEEEEKRVRKSMKSLRVERHDETEEGKTEKTNKEDKSSQEGQEDNDNEESNKETKDEPVGDVSSRHLEHIADLITQCFLNIHVGDIESAKKIIVGVTNAIELLSKLDNSVEYVCGFDFLKSCLEIHLMLKDSNTEHSKGTYEKVLSSRFGLIDDFPDESKAVIYAVKWHFLELFHNRKNDSVEALRNVAKLDVKNFNWNYLLCMRLRFIRRELSGTSTKPDDEEIQASVASFETSKKLDGSDRALEYAMARAALSQTISEVLKWRISNNVSNVPISFGEITFNSNQEIIKYLKKEARAALSRFPKICFGEFMRYAEIFSTGLPPQHRNYEIAILCMTFCLRIMPRNSKANHKMGGLYLVGDEDVKEAIEFFRKAVKFEPKNFPASMDLVQALLQSPIENGDELDGLFKTMFDKTWTHRQMVSLNFVHGCYLFIKGQRDKAIDIWLSYEECDEQQQEEMFHNLFRLKNRYHWPDTVMTLKELERAISDRLQSTDDNDMRLERLKRIRDEITSGSRQDRGNNFRSGDMSTRQSNSVRGNYYNRNGNNSGSYNSRQSGNYHTRSGNNSGPYNSRQRHRSPSPENWRNHNNRRVNNAIPSSDSWRNHDNRRVN